MQDERGLRILRQAIVDGRVNRVPRLVDADGQITHGDGEDGKLQPDPDGPEFSLTDQ